MVYLLGTVAGILEDVLIPIVALVVIFGSPVCIIAILTRYRLKRQNLHNELLKAAIEAGRDISPDLLAPPQIKTQKNMRIRLMVGLVLIGFGVAVFFMELFHKHCGYDIGSALKGLIFILPGICLLIADYFIRKDKNAVE